jgi:hypothetical protein
MDLDLYTACDKFLNIRGECSWNTGSVCNIDCLYNSDQAAVDAVVPVSIYFAGVTYTSRPSFYRKANEVCFNYFKQNGCLGSFYGTALDVNQPSLYIGSESDWILFLDHTPSCDWRPRSTSSNTNTIVIAVCASVGVCIIFGVAALYFIWYRKKKSVQDINSATITVV